MEEIATTAWLMVEADKIHFQTPTVEFWQMRDDWAVRRIKQTMT